MTTFEEMRSMGMFDVGISWLLRDDFTDTLAAGAVNGTYATDGKNLRTVADTNSIISLSSGLKINGTPVANDRLTYPTTTRVAGRLLLFYLKSGTIPSSNYGIGFVSGVNQYHVFAKSYVYEAGSGINIDVASPSTGPFYYALILRNNGAFFFGKSSGYWILHITSMLKNPSPLGAGIDLSATPANNIILGFVRVPLQTWLPTPLASDSFNRADGAIGVTDGAGHAEANGGAGLAWTGGAISGNAMAISPTLGGELASGALVVGTWYQITATQADHFYVGCAINDTFRATATTALDANNKVKAITLASMIATLPPLSTVNVLADDETSVLTAKTQCGRIARCDDPANPLNFIIAYFDGSGNIKVDDCAAGSYTNKLNVAKAFGASDHLILDVNGTAVRLYHVTAAGVATLIGSYTTAITTGNYFGEFSSLAANKINSTVIWPKGVEGQYSFLDKFIN